MTLRVSCRIYERTGPYRHWLRSGDEEQGPTEYELRVERELAKYR
jgi:hypothetical protein